jgi:hypothetical protein
MWEGKSQQEVKVQYQTTDALLCNSGVPSQQLKTKKETMNTLLTLLALLWSAIIAIGSFLLYALIIVIHFITVLFNVIVHLLK